AIGSSRIMPLDTSTVGETVGEYYNHGMSGAGIYDYLGIVGLYKNNLPSHVILGLDPWILNDNNPDTRYQGLDESISECIDAMRNYSNGEIPEAHRFVIDSKYLEAVSPAYFQSAILSLLQGKVRDKISVTVLTDLHNGGIMSDGSRIDSAEVLNMSVAQSDENAKQYCADPENVYLMNGYSSLSKNYRALLEELVVWLTNQHVKISFYLPPFHPIVYSEFSSNQALRIVLQSEEYFRELAALYDIDVYGSYNPALCGGSNDDFSDGMHIKSNRIGTYWELTNKD
ncbi:MAG: hypothetical protein Q4B42_06745, partial [Oscillospiraceae bacterium]|nr:hypothetical protein [Oscillospiraceae bacterium]